MAFGRHKRGTSGAEREVRKSVKISKSDQDKLKVRTITVHDPILNAVNEQQPFQDASFDQKKIHSLSMMLASQGEVRDVFGNPVTRPDISNPTRSRDERPMDTIRSFEYAITRDDFYKLNLETPIYGWSVRPTYPLLPQNMPQYTSNPYDNYAPGSGPQSVPRNVEQPVYQAAPKAPKKKQKRGFFGRKKKAV